MSHENDEPARRREVGVQHVVVNGPRARLQRSWIFGQRCRWLGRRQRHTASTGRSELPEVALARRSAEQAEVLQEHRPPRSGMSGTTRRAAPAEAASASSGGGERWQ